MIDPEAIHDSERFTVHLDDLNPADDKASFWETWVGRCVVANGCFDGLHPGHLSLLAHLDTIAYQRGLRPIVALNSDSSVKQLKGIGRPFFPQDVRAKLINHLKWPFTVVIFAERTPQRLMDFLQPKVVVKGGEYVPGFANVVRWRDSEVVCVPMLGGWSTTRLLGDTR